MTRVVSSGTVLFQIMIKAKVGQQMSANLGTWSTRNASHTRNTAISGHSFSSDPR